MVRLSEGVSGQKSQQELEALDKTWRYMEAQARKKEMSAMIKEMASKNRQKKKSVTSKEVGGRPENRQSNGVSDPNVLTVPDGVKDFEGMVKHIFGAAKLEEFKRNSGVAVFAFHKKEGEELKLYELLVDSKHGTVTLFEDAKPVRDGKGVQGFVKVLQGVVEVRDGAVNTPNAVVVTKKEFGDFSRKRQEELSQKEEPKDFLSMVKKFVKNNGLEDLDESEDIVWIKFKYRGEDWNINVKEEVVEVSYPVEGDEDKRDGNEYGYIEVINDVDKLEDLVEDENKEEKHEKDGHFFVTYKGMSGFAKLFENMSKLRAVQKDFKLEKDGFEEVVIDRKRPALKLSSVPGGILKNSDKPRLKSEGKSALEQGNQKQMDDGLKQRVASMFGQDSLPDNSRLARFTIKKGDVAYNYEVNFETMEIQIFDKDYKLLDKDLKPVKSSEEKGELEEKKKFDKMKEVARMGEFVASAEKRDKEGFGLDALNALLEKTGEVFEPGSLSLKFIARGIELGEVSEVIEEDLSGASEDLTSRRPSSSVEAIGAVVQLVAVRVATAVPTKVAPGKFIDGRWFSEGASTWYIESKKTSKSPTTSKESVIMSKKTPLPSRGQGDDTAGGGTKAADANRRLFAEALRSVDTELGGGGR